MSHTMKDNRNEIRPFYRSGLLKTSMLAVVVVGLHIVAVGGFFTIQGCGTVQNQKAVEPAPAPVMPPRVTREKATIRSTRPAIRPPVAVEPAPAMVAPADLQTYTIRSGDSLSKVAHRFGVSARELAEINGIKNQNMIRIGQKLVLPAYAKKQAPAPKKMSRPKKKKATPKTVAPGSLYVVQSGDVLSRIAVRHGTTVKALRSANKLTSDRILVGQKLVIPGGVVAPVKSIPAKIKAPVKPASIAAPKAVQPAIEIPIVEETVVMDEERVESSLSSENPYYYTVQEGDSLNSVGMVFSLSQEELMKANNIQEDTPLTPGQRLIIPFP